MPVMQKRGTKNRLLQNDRHPLSLIYVPERTNCARTGKIANCLYFCTMLNVKTDVETDLLDDTDLLVAGEEPCHLIVWNDEVNTFEWVIETLMTVCGHSHEQAEQCSYIIHFRGKYAVKNGSYDDLKPFCDAITERGINATIEVVAG